MATVKCKQKKRWVSGCLSDGTLHNTMLHASHSAALKRATTLAHDDYTSTVFEQTDILKAEKPPVSHCKLT